MRYLLDTNVLSELVRPAPEARVLDWIEAHSPLELGISVLTLGELTKGIGMMAVGPRRDALERWVVVELAGLFRGRVLPVSEAIAVAWGELAAGARRTGRVLPVIDGLLLATAQVHDLTLATRNTEDCAGRGVAVVDPWR